jgi:hypothetical protein
LEEEEIGYYNFDNYSLISKYCRKNKKHGGSCIYVNKYLETKPYNLFNNLNQEEHFEASIVELTQHNIIIVCVYRTPTSNLNVFIETMETIISNLTNKGKNIIIVGDLNIDFLGERINLQLHTMLNAYGLQAIIDVPTRIGPTHSDVQHLHIHWGCEVRGHTPRNLRRVEPTGGVCSEERCWHL